MRRRDFITLLGGAAAWPLAAHAQQAEQVRRIGALIGVGAASDPVVRSYADAFRDELAKLGWIEGHNLHIDLRYADGDVDVIHASAAELIRLAPEVILASTGAAERELQFQTRSIPVVFVGPSDVAVGLQNIAHPEGNLTGFPILYPSIAGKWLELLKEVAPDVDTIGVIMPASGGRAGPTYVPAIEKAASEVAVKSVAIPFVHLGELERSLDAFGDEPNRGLIVLPSSQTGTRDNRGLISRLAQKHHVPAIHFDKLYPAEGGLMSYGSDPVELHRRAAAYVDRILRGAKVSDLPVQLPTKFELVINHKAAEAIGLSISPAFLARADEVIE